MNILEEMIRTVPDMKLIVNGDDALSAYMAMDSGNPCVYYGISHPVMRNETNEIREGRFCKKCGERLQYSFYHYSHTGTLDAELFHSAVLRIKVFKLPEYYIHYKIHGNLQQFAFPLQRN